MPERFWPLAVLSFALIITSFFIFGFFSQTGYAPAVIALISASLFPVILFSILYFAEICEEMSLWLFPWVRDAEEMRRRFNPIFSTWVYYHDWKKWKRNAIKSGLVATFFIGASILWLITLRWVTLWEFSFGVLIGATFTTLLAIPYYQRYA